MVTERMHLVFNPAANRGRAAAQRGEISSFLEARGVEAVWHVTEGSGHATGIVGGLPEDAVAVAVGGDGTVHEVAAACSGTGRAFGVLPVGSGNDYVKALGVGTDLRGALEVLARGRVRVVDAGEVNGIRFNNGLGIGFDAQVADGVTRAPRYLGGFGGYLWSVVRLLWGFRCHRATLRLDGGEAVRSKTLLVAAALGTTYGARFRLAPGAKLDDGLLDVVWSGELSVTEILGLMPAVLRGTHLEHPKIHLARAREVRVELEEASPAHVDGELLKPTRSFEARVIPGALRVVAP
ncbi:MAG: diacylglycerol kinase family lipid kinase [Rubrobacter sp.]|nr:diacylglycerol kinase family lipid kinase [Rubrobacter sp.]